MQFFQPYHYAAFDGDKPNLDTPAVRAERFKVRDKLLELDSQLAPFIVNKGWDLHRHRQSEHYTSSCHFVFAEKDNGDLIQIVTKIRSMWLHYGKSNAQLDFWRGNDGDSFKNAFYVHTRMQVYINHDCLAFWLVFGDKNLADRNQLIWALRNDEKYRERFLSRIRQIQGRGFKYYIYKEEGGLIVREDYFELGTEIIEPDLIRFIKSDSLGCWSGIIKEYTPDDARISEGNIVKKMQDNLVALYPLYDLMSWRPPVGI